MSDHPTHTRRFPVFRRLWKPAAVVGAGGTAAVIWFEDIIVFGEEILAMILLPVMACVIYLLDIVIFRSRMPRRSDMEDTTKPGVRK